MNRWDAVYSRIKDIKNPIGAEIGVYKGDFSKNILTLHEGLKLHMIDSWSESTYDDKGNDSASEPFRKIYTLEADKNYKTAFKSVFEFKDRALLIKNFSMEAVNFFTDEYFDFVFIDAAHDYDSVIEDIKAWMPKVKKGGYICGHDYGCWEGVTKAVDKMFSGRTGFDTDFTWFARI